MEIDLKKDSEKLLMVLDGVVTPIVYMNANLQYVFINKAYMDWYELRREEIEGKYIRDILSADVYERALPNYQAALRGESVYFENKTIRKGEEKYVSVRLSPHCVNEEVIGFFSNIIDITARKKAEEEREKLINELQDALKEIKTLRGILPICSSCKKIRDDKGYWQPIDAYIYKHTDAQLSHGLCPDCVKKIYPNLYKKV